SADLDVLDKFQIDGRQVALYVERTNREGLPLWLVSPESVAEIPQLVQLQKESPIERRLPEPLVKIEWIDTPLWIWIALTLIALLLSFISRLLSRAVLLIVNPLVKRYAKPLDTYRLESFSEPVRL